MGSDLVGSGHSMKNGNQYTIHHGHIINISIPGNGRMTVPQIGYLIHLLIMAHRTNPPPQKKLCEALVNNWDKQDSAGNKN